MRNKIIASLLFIFSSVLNASPYPITVFDRPFTMPQNGFESGLSFGDQQIAQLSFAYGITDKFQMGLSWGGASTSGLEAERKISLNAAHFLFVTYRVSAMTKLSVPLYFHHQTLQELSWGMPMFIALYKGHVNLVLLEDLFTLNWAEDVRARFRFKTRLSWQATPVFCLNLSTEPASLSTAGDHGHIAQKSPLYLSGLYSVTSLVDIIASVGYSDVQEIKKPSFMLGVLFRGGSVES